MENDSHEGLYEVNPIKSKVLYAKSVRVFRSLFQGVYYCFA